MLSLRRSLQTIAPRLALQQHRQLSSSIPRSNLFDFFRRAGVKDESKPVPKQTKTKDVMKELESGESEVVSDKRVKLRVLGAPPKDESWEQERNQFEVNAWPLKATAPELQETQVTEALQNAYNKHFTSSNDTSASYLDQSLDDLNLRFSYTKEVSRELSVIIPDAVLSKVQTIGDVYEYLTTKVAGRRYDENQPEAIYLDPKEFEGLNITIRDAISEKRNKKLRFKEALAGARNAEKARQEELLQKALNS
ncbi:hypothetical protein AWJ20_4166 [Sugiyamaella lignohabitans]|uniref:Large ribosomal subunit protein mL50 n=1 Tax=Sugiyamaella lignohabitans TaxID=796027 RepID=A0A167C8M7_9ASCO|nr:uncharacterized protein AWJ20_4166 [Sugiyamaella lignohabitans]ANB11360.1 hypothetical protein AWJ20_4166 [Sugiyamaella lignohabitans]